MLDNPPDSPSFPLLNFAFGDLLGMIVLSNCLAVVWLEFRRPSEAQKGAVAMKLKCQTSYTPTP